MPIAWAAHPRSFRAPYRPDGHALTDPAHTHVGPPRMLLPWTDTFGHPAVHGPAHTLRPHPAHPLRGARRRAQRLPHVPVLPPWPGLGLPIGRTSASGVSAKFRASTGGESLGHEVDGWCARGGCALKPESPARRRSLPGRVVKDSDAVDRSERELSVLRCFGLWRRGR